MKEGPQAEEEIDDEPSCTDSGYGGSFQEALPESEQNASKASLLHRGESFFYSVTT